MNAILLRDILTDEEQAILKQEFPLYACCSDLKQPLTAQQWQNIEIIYSYHLTIEELKQAPQLRWIHSPKPFIDQLCSHEIKKRTGIVITNTKGENIFQMGEFVMGGILTLAKGFLHWHALKTDQKSPWKNPPEQPMWCLKDKTLLQVGLGMVGTEIARRAKQMGLRVWGVRRRPSFHPYCSKVFSSKDIHALLPAADIVSLSLPRGQQYNKWFGSQEIGLLKEDSILIATGSGGVVDEAALIESPRTKSLRGIILDIFQQSPLPKTSPLWKLPNLLVTPEVSNYPKCKENHAFRTFSFNLRQYSHGNFLDMKNLILP